MKYLKRIVTLRASNSSKDVLSTINFRQDEAVRYTLLKQYAFKNKGFVDGLRFNSKNRLQYHFLTYWFWLLMTLDINLLLDYPTEVLQTFLFI